MITSHPTAPDGSVATLESFALSDFSNEDAVLCRNAAPLIDFAFGCIRRQRGVKILGREIGESLAKVVEAAKATSIDELEQKLVAMREREIKRALSRDLPIGPIEDKYNCLDIFVQNCETVGEVTELIDRLFNSKAANLLTLATIHRSKGLEWPTVFILDRNLIPSKYATQPWQQNQERNLLYVAITRAKLNLRYIASGSWREPVQRPVQA